MQEYPYPLLVRFNAKQRKIIKKHAGKQKHAAFIRDLIDSL